MSWNAPDEWISRMSVIASGIRLLGDEGCMLLLNLVEHVKADDASQAVAALFYYLWSTPSTAAITHEAIERVSGFEKHVRAPYHPDGVITRPDVHLFAAATLAVLLERCDQRSERLLEVVEDAVREDLAYSLARSDWGDETYAEYLHSDYIDGLPAWLADCASDEQYPYYGALAFLYAERAVHLRAECEYSEAFRHAAFATRVAATAGIPLWCPGTADSGNEEPPRPSFEMSPSDIGSFFEIVRANRESVEDWDAIRWPCHWLAETDVSGLWEDSDVSPEQGESLPWQPFWSYAKGWADSRLSKSQWLALREEEQRREAETRLRSYFFDHKQWAALPPKCQSRLVNADLVWSRMEGDVGTILDQLRVATAVLLNECFWAPFIQAMPEKQHRRLRESFKVYGSDDPSPSTWRDYILKDVQFRSFVNGLPSLTNEDRAFVCGSRGLAMDLSHLMIVRNDAEYGRSALPRGRVKPLLDRWLGINVPGILPRLADIALKQAIGYTGNTGTHLT